MPARSIRTTVKRELFKLLADEFSGTAVGVAYSPPTEGVQDRQVFLGNIEGTVTYPTSRATRFQRDDDFTITIWIRAHVDGDGDGTEADEAAELIYGAVEDLFADTPGPGLDVDGVQEAVLADVDGPYPMRTTTGHESWIEARVDVSTRLT